MKNIILILFCFACILFPLKSFSQNRNNVWVFGDRAGIDFSGVAAQSISTNICSRGSCSSICDSSGNLQFYISSTTKSLFAQFKAPARIYNKKFKTMKNGDSIAGDLWYKEFEIIPMPLQNNLYYTIQAGETNFVPGLFYSIIDINANYGKGEVMQKNIRLEDSTFLCNDGLAAIKHGNGRDWWVICRNWGHYTDTFNFYLATPNGIAYHHSQKISDNLFSGFYRIEPSNDGNKIACCTNKGFLSTFDFDRCTGLLSNEVNISHETTNPNLYNWVWDCELSNNNKYLYVSQSYNAYDTSNYLFRYNLQSANIAASIDTLYAGAFRSDAGLIELAPDGKMYWACANLDSFVFNYPYPDSLHNYITDNLSVINYPDSSYCDFQPFSFYLGGKRTYYGLPNNPNYELGPDTGSVCDSLGLLTPETPKPPLWGLNTTYISAWEKLFVNAQNLKGKHVTITIYDAAGKEKFARGKPPGGGLGVYSGYFTLDVDCTGWSGGLYVVHLETEAERLSRKFVRE